MRYKVIRLLGNKYLGYAILLISAHLFWLSIIKKQYFSELLINAWFLSLSKGFVSEAYLNHPAILETFSGYLSSLLGSVFLALDIINRFSVVIIDLLLFFYIFKRNGIKIATIGLLFFIPWQIFFKGGAVWFDLLIVPFLFLSYITFSNFVNSKKRQYLFLTGLVLAAGYFFKQIVISFSLFFSIWIIVDGLVKRKFSKLFADLVILNVPVLIAIVLNTLYFSTKTTIGYAFEWSFIMPFFVYPRMEVYSKVIRPEYQIVVTSLLVFLFFCLIVIQRLQFKMSLQNLLLYCVTLLSFYNTFPRWGDFRMQSFVFFLTIVFIQALLNLKEYKNEFLKRFLIFIFLGFLALIPSYYFFRIKAEKITGNIHLITLYNEFTPYSKASLFTGKSVYIMDEMTNYDYIPEPFVELNLFQKARLVYTKPDEYIKIFSPATAYEHILAKKPDFLLIPPYISDAIQTKTLETSSKDFGHLVSSNYKIVEQFDSEYITYQKI